MNELKKLVATFINKNAEEINENTVIDKTVVKGSILIHRMYAALATNGFHVKNYNKIQKYGDLINELNGSTPQEETNTEKNTLHKLISDDKQSNVSKMKGLGIDIEKISNLPTAIDFRTDEFYIQNFTQTEISYCIIQQNPLESFAGLFCIKEAIYKANNKSSIKKYFNNIEIGHTSTGAPICTGFIISLSHTDDIVVAVAIPY